MCIFLMLTGLQKMIDLTRLRKVSPSSGLYFRQILKKLLLKILQLRSVAFHKAGQQHKAVEVLEQLTHNAVVENRYGMCYAIILSHPHPE